ncbi:MAG TPA: isochorismatase family cysteine hydrolase [Alphaproteobacteria bacterium]|nr:isochorismatase family cysteine hydrolase [Alphaproteobacteria bacterium]
MAEVSLPDSVTSLVRGRRAALHPFDRIEPRRTALLVVDMQTAFLKEGWPTALAAARDIVPAINRLAGAVRRSGGEVVWIVSTYGPDEDDRWPILFDHMLGPAAGGNFRAVLTAGHEGHAIWPLLERRPDDPVVSKNRFSAFCGSNGALEALLRRHGIDTVLVVGTVTNICCESTAREASFRDFKTIMVADANAGRSSADNLATFSSFILAFGDVMTADEVIARLEAGAAPGKAATG